MYGLGPMEIAVVAVLVVIIFGPKRIPQIARAIADSIQELRKAGRQISGD